MLGKLAKHLFPSTHTLPHVSDAGDVFYIVGVIVGIILWGFAIVWFIVAIMMIATSGGFPFNMGWWGFIFPVGVFTLLTISLGEELESRFFKVLSCVCAPLSVLACFLGGTLLMVVCAVLGIDCHMCHHVARRRGGDNPTIHQWQDVLRTVSRYRSVRKEVQVGWQGVGKIQGHRMMSSI